MRVRSGSPAVAGNAPSRTRHQILIVPRVHDRCDENLANVVVIHGHVRPVLCGRQRRQHQCRKNGDDGDYGQHFDQRETPSFDDADFQVQSPFARSVRFNKSKRSPYRNHRDFFVPRVPRLSHRPGVESGLAVHHEPILVMPMRQHDLDKPPSFVVPLHGQRVPAVEIPRQLNRFRPGRVAIEMDRPERMSRRARFTIRFSFHLDIGQSPPRMLTRTKARGTMQRLLFPRSGPGPS